MERHAKVKYDELEVLLEERGVKPSLLTDWHRSDLMHFAYREQWDDVNDIITNILRDEEERQETEDQDYDEYGEYIGED